MTCDAVYQRLPYPVVIDCVVNQHQLTRAPTVFETCFVSIPRLGRLIISLGKNSANHIQLPEFETTPW